jgi:glyoxylase-like metal-dependent hydrolase (beta-lactamase superfamily II)
MTWTTTAPPYLCTNCGFWQRSFCPPPWCPICIDPRHAPPRDGWVFWSVEDARARLRTEIVEVEPGLWRAVTTPPVGIGGSGYLVQTDAGTTAFEACAWYDDAALATIAALGGLRWVAASHPHTYGALWQLQERFGCEVSVGVDDLGWTGAFTVTWPLDDRLRLEPGLTLHLTAGHFPGHAVLHEERRRVLFCGDALKLDLGTDGRTAHAISTHKGFLRRIPLSLAEVRRYRDVFAPLDFTQTWTPFEQGANADRAAALHLLDTLLATRPSLDHLPLPGRPLDEEDR